MIAVYNDSGRILWSWHIWVTDADIDANLQPWTVHSDLSGYSAYQSPQLMDRNLGALGTADWAASSTNISKGLYYQWGRKDPFPRQDDSAWNSNKIITTYDSAGNEIGGYSSASSFSNAAKWTYIEQYLTWEDIAAYPMAFISGPPQKEGKAYYFWLEEMAHDLWGLLYLGDEANTLGHKTIYDPCPPGYRVMNPYAMTGVTPTVNGGKYSNMTSHNVLNNTTYRTSGDDLEVKYDGTNIATLPANGMMYFESNRYANMLGTDRSGQYSFMWTTRMSDTNVGRAHRMHYDWNNFIPMEAGYVMYGHGVRCEKIK